MTALDEHITERGQASAPSWVRERRRRQGLPNYRIVRYADDFAVLVAGTRDDTQAVREQVAAVLATIGLRLSAEKTTICHIDEGFEFLGGASSATSSEAVTGGSSTPIPPARPLRR